MPRTPNATLSRTPSFDVRVALLAVTEAMQLTVRNYTKCRFAVIVVPDPKSTESYRQALDHYCATFFTRTLKTKRTYYLEVRPRDPVVAMIAYSDYEHIFVLVADIEQVTPEVRLVADRVIEVRPTTADDFTATAKAMGVQLSRSETELLTSQNLRTVGRAFINDRPASDAIRRLRIYVRDSLVVEEPAPAPEKAAKTARSLQQMHGYGSAKEWGLRLAVDLADWKAGKIEWEDVDKGVLLNGPPGVGKTVFAKALANSCSVPFIHASLAKWQAAGHMGDLLKAMHKTFDEARAAAPCILLLDELDSFGDRDRLRGENAEYNQKVINGFLEVLDGAERRDGVVIVGATNRIDDVDPAIYRAGRLERIIHIALPSAIDRMEILRSNLPQLPPSGSVLFDRATEGWTGADIERLARTVRREARHSGVETTFALVERYLAEPAVLDDAIFWRVCVHEAGHALVASLLVGRTVQSLSVIPYAPVKDNRIGQVVVADCKGEARTRNWYESQIAIALAGLAAENILLAAFADSGGGDEASDLNKANFLAACIVAGHGMDGTWLVEPELTPDRLRQLRRSDGRLCRKVDRIMATQFSRVVAFLEEHRHRLTRLAEAVSEHHSLNQDQIETILRGDAF